MSVACHLYITRMYLHVIYMSLVCTRISPICHSYVLVCHPHITRMHTYVIRMLFVCHLYVTRQDLELSYLIFKIIFGKIIAFGRFQEIFGYYVVPIPILFIGIFLRLTIGSSNLKNLKERPYYTL